MKTILCRLGWWISTALVLCGAETSAPKIKWESPEDRITDSKAFPALQTEARRINQKVREALVVPSREWFPREEVSAFGQRVKQEAGRALTTAEFPKIDVQLEYFRATLATADQPRDDLPTLNLQRQMLGIGDVALHYGFVGNVNNQGTLSSAERIKTITVNGVTDSKEEALKSLDHATRPYQLTLSAYTAYQTRLLLQDLADEWDAYFEKGRPQSFIDVMVTTLLEYRHIKRDYLVGPPPRQWFALHPNVVVENLKSAPDGNQMRGAVAIEWIGVNWWKGFGGKMPFGISLTSLYSDRAGVDDIGHGVCLYFANKYCIGWASHGGDDGFYVSMDALKLIDNKRSKIDGYRSRLQSMFGVR